MAPEAEELLASQSQLRVRGVRGSVVRGTDILTLATLRRWRFAETWPNTVAPSIAEFARRMEVLIDRSAEYWLVFDSQNRALGVARLKLTTRSLTSRGDLDIYLPKSQRGAGIGLQLLRVLVQRGLAAGVDIFQTATISSIEDGDRFVKRFDASLVAASLMLEASLADVQLAIVQGLDSLRYVDLTLEYSEGAYQDPKLTSIIPLKRLIAKSFGSTQSETDIASWMKTIRQEEQLMARFGVRRWTIFAYEIQSHQLVGFNEFTWDPLEPHVLHQTAGAVFEAYRGRRIAIWMRGQLLQHILHGVSGVKTLRVKIPDARCAELNKNLELRYHVCHRTCHWEINAEPLRRRLSDDGNALPTTIWCETHGGTI